MAIPYINVKIFKKELKLGIMRRCNKGILQRSFETIVK